MNYTSHTQTIDIYFNEIRKNQSLTVEDERILFARIANGDMMARTEIFNKMAKLAVNIAKTFMGNPVMLSDLIQEANMGILEAIEKYDISTGFRFSSYARWWMRAYILKFLNDQNLLRRSNFHMTEKVKRIRKEFFKTYQRDASEYEVLEILEEMGEKVTDLSILHTLCVSSIDDHFVDSDEDMMSTGKLSMDLSVDSDFEESIEMEDIIEMLRKKMMVLNDREKRLIALKFGIGQDYEMDYDAIANREGLTSERCRQIVTGAIKKMR